MEQACFLGTIWELLTHPQNLSTTILQFSFTFPQDAVTANWEMLKEFDMNLHHAIQANRHLPVYFGSEFHHWSHLKPLLECHPLWPIVKNYL